MIQVGCLRTVSVLLPGWWSDFVEWKRDGDNDDWLVRGRDVWRSSINSDSSWCHRLKRDCAIVTDAPLFCRIDLRLLLSSRPTADAIKSVGKESTHSVEGVGSIVSVMCS